MGLINNDQPYIFQFQFFVIQTVVQRLHHCHKTFVLVLVWQFFDFAIDDFILDLKTCQHFGSLFAKFNTMCQYHNFLVVVMDVTTNDFGKNDSLPSASRQLVKQIVIVRRLIEYFKNTIEVSELIIVKVLFCVLVFFYFDNVWHTSGFFKKNSYKIKTIKGLLGAIVEKIL